ncbi:MAG: energy transducer TonB [Gammaproteobacteria bacterium]|nr:energy transducer TonB [Gammaproteobacteria bacterium]
MNPGRFTLSVSMALILGIIMLGMTPSQSKSWNRSVTLGPNQDSALYPIHKVDKPYPFTHGHQVCGRIEFMVNAKGKPESFHVWSHYFLPDNTHKIEEKWLDPNFFDLFIMGELAEWKFRPRVVNGKAVPTTHVVLDYELTSFSVVKINRGKLDEDDIEGWAALAWLCSLPPMHGVPVVAIPGTASKPSKSIIGFGARDGETMDLGPDHIDLGLDLLPQTQSTGEIWLELCIDTHGHPRNITVWKHKSNPSYALAARRALEQLKFPALDVSGRTMLACGLHIRFQFEAAPRKAGAIIGLIGPANFKVLSEASPVPKLVKQKPVKLSLSIPPGTRLPPEARVKLRLCIEKDGSVSHPVVVKAHPRRLFDQAAIKTVNGWRFEKLPTRMCDVYEWVKFPLR